MDGKRDLAIRDGRVAAVAADLAPERAVRTADVTGLYVTPGLIDLHAHFFGGGGGSRNFEMHADQYTLPNGTTTVVDAGGPGWTNFGGFLERVIVPSRTRVLALLNICAAGMISDRESLDEELQVEQYAETIQEFRRHIVGVKAAHYMVPGCGPEWMPACGRERPPGRL